MSAIGSLAGFTSVLSATKSRRRTVVAMASPTSAAVASAPGKGLYGVLGVAERASSREIKAAYRSLAKRWHPDVAGDVGAEEFLEIHRAYSTLSDPAAREVYDRSIGQIGLGFRRSERFRTARRWETDQCW
ncbi:Chaperone protein dnaJ 11, chloroplastic [Apostasia shenzhenica]|uniref:Chaperone protein dnaJ 11, chloroplastic n=1 Tax=Apostasia shenzhenica TaxID=1088818 RepID=A0A2I0AXQ5_9ASPA|nr:Chaperone protein dnaJ 11, chloroplastic [Apostasia shenzhenica]